MFYDVAHRLLMDYVTEADYNTLLLKALYKSRFQPQRACSLPGSKQQDLRRWNLHLTWADSNKVSARNKRVDSTPTVLALC